MTALILILGLLMAGAPAHPAKLMSAEEVARRLDVTSFDNSTGPRRRPGARTLGDYGFTNPASTSRDYVTVYRYADGDVRWLFGVDILSRSGRTLTLCITDKAVGSGTYYFVYPIEVVEGAGGLLQATGRRVTGPKCGRDG
jgi:hypothetical protein